MPRSRATRLRNSRAPADAELNALSIAPAEPSPYLYPTAAAAVSAFTFDKVMAATVDERTTVVFILRHGIVARTVLCRHCDDEMTMDAACRRWRCRRKGCRDHELSVRAGCFFAKSKLPLSKCLRLLLFWSSGLPVSLAAQWREISDVTAIDWYSFCRDICSKEMLSCSMQIGGPGHIVEIDETSLEKKSKYGRGRQHPDNWLFGGVDRTTNLWFGILTGADRKKKTLSPIIRKHVKAGTTIISDQFASYVSVNGNHTLENYHMLRDMRYTHIWVNHDNCFVDPVTGAHTNRIEGAWEIRVKRHQKRMRGIHKVMLPGYLDEFLWKTWFFPGKVPPCTILEGLVMGIRKHYQV